MRRVTVVSVCLLVGVSLVLGTARIQAAKSFASPLFQSQWQAGEALAPNFWGPLALAHDGQQESYKEASGGMRLVQYFDKARMELTNPNGPVTNGLLATEMMTGRVQTGDATFLDRPLPMIAVAGDPDARNPTYADVKTKAPALFAPTPTRSGDSTKVLFTKENGLFPANVSYVQAPPAGFFAGYDAATQHNVMDVFGDYRDQVGVNTVGLAISEPFGVSVYVGGEQTVVLMQVFERRVLTYKRTNPDPYKVEFGNIGQHYYQWRYGADGGVTAAPAVPSTPAASSPAAPPVTVGSFVPGQSLSRPTAANNDNFGGAVTLSGDGSILVVVSIPTKRSAGRVAVPVYDHGTVYVYRRNGDSYGTPQTLTTPAGMEGAFFNAMALSANGGTLAVGGYDKSGAQNWVYVYHRNDGSYGTPQTLTDPLATDGGGFGSVVALSADGDTLAVRGHGGGSAEERVYVYRRNGDSYGTPQTLTDPLATDGGGFGDLMALSADGDTFAVGGYDKSSAEGRVYVYHRNGDSYGTPQTLTDPARVSESSFANAIALSGNGDTLAVRGDDKSNKGIVYTYHRKGGSYGTPQTLTTPAGIDTALFGHYVALSADGGTLAVGAPSTSRGQGTVYIFTAPPAASSAAAFPIGQVFIDASRSTNGARYAMEIGATTGAATTTSVTILPFEHGTMLYLPSRNTFFVLAG